MTEAVLYGVGVGPGDPELLTLKALRIIESCPVIAAPLSRKGSTYARDIVSQVTSLEHKKMLSLSLPMTKDKQKLDDSYQQAADVVLEELDAGRDVAVLTLGDPSIYSSFNRLKPYIEKRGYKVTSIPGVPSFCAVAAVLEENLTPCMDTPFHVIPSACENFDEALDVPGTKIIMKSGLSLSSIKSLLRKKGLYDQAGLVQNCGLSDELVVHHLDDIDEARYLTTIVVRS